MAYWYFDTNAISTLNDLREELGWEVIHHFLAGNSILITRRNYHEIRMGRIESKRFIELAGQVDIFQLESDLASQDEVYRANGYDAPTPSVTLLKADGVKFTVESGVLAPYDVGVKSAMHKKYLQQFLDDRKLVTNEIMVVFGIYLGISSQARELGLTVDLSKINHISYPSTYAANFVSYYWFLKNSNKEIVENDFYDLINSAAAPLVQRFYSEGGLIQALTSVKNCVPSKLPRALERGKQKFPTLGLPDPKTLKDKYVSVEQPMLQGTELYRLSDLRNHVYKFVR
jgi:hypothetical protein